MFIIFLLIFNYWSGTVWPKQNTKCQKIHNKCLIMTDCTLATKQHVSGSWRQSMNNRSNTHEYLCNVCSLDILPWNNTQGKKRRININNNYICCLKDPPRVALAFKEIFMILWVLTRTQEVDSTYWNISKICNTIYLDSKHSTQCKQCI